MVTQNLHHKKSPEISQQKIFKKNLRRKSKWLALFKIISKIILFFLSILLLMIASLIIYISTLTIPDFSNFAERQISNSTQIYDKTGETLLYDFHADIKRIQVSGNEISRYVKNATIAIEDREFYKHRGFNPSSFVRALIANLKAGKFVQGGSTINQQIIKNALLTKDKNLIRKFTEIVMAIKLDAEVSKNDILTIYLNDNPYGGNIYGIETAANYFFGKKAVNLTLAESAYLTALPNAPSYYSPYGNHLSDLEKRKTLILNLMLKENMISQEEYDKAQTEKVVWQDNNINGKALHFVFFVKDYLEQKYGKNVVDSGGLKVLTTLNYDWQSQAEKIVNQFALQNDKNYHATNAGLIAIDPKNGQIVSMVGSRNYFDTKIPGQYNITTALRQPGSSIKPIVYATAFKQGLSPNTVLFDIDTEFNTTCDSTHNPLPGYEAAICYHPVNYDEDYRGPITLREALAQSINIPAVKILYLAGLRNTIDTIRSMGISSISQNGDYGLSLVLGSGEVSLLELTNSYATFANNGIYNPAAFILSVSDKNGNILEQYTHNPRRAISENITDQISDILADYVAKIPAYGENSLLFFSDRPVASKTGTTNSFRDTWTIGYTPNIAVGVWAGNNDNTPINKKLSGLVAVPMWRAFMDIVNASTSISVFKNPNIPISPNPIVNGIYCENLNGKNIFKSILTPNDPQYNNWKTSIDTYTANHLCPFNTTTETFQDASMGNFIFSSTTSIDDVNVENNKIR